MRRDCFKAVRRLPGDNNDRTPERGKRGWPQGARKQATERTDGDKEKEVTFVTGKQPEKRPTKKSRLKDSRVDLKGHRRRKTKRRSRREFSQEAERVEQVTAHRQKYDVCRNDKIEQRYLQNENQL